ncbi:MAG TPA: hypothetical protein VFS68_05935 [Candidatus Udaeobacter sp.]|nr:hypothetical protein [Candidatus Udaeobacter sp.]
MDKRITPRGSFLVFLTTENAHLGETFGRKTSDCEDISATLLKIRSCCVLAFVCISGDAEQSHGVRNKSDETVKQIFGRVIGETLHGKQFDWATDQVHHVGIGIYRQGFVAASHDMFMSR